MRFDANKFTIVINKAIIIDLITVSKPIFESCIALIARMTEKLTINPTLKFTHNCLFLRIVIFIDALRGLKDGLQTQPT
jgi:hypothetical protein